MPFDNDAMIIENNGKNPFRKDAFVTVGIISLKPSPPASARLYRVLSMQEIICFPISAS